MENFFGPSEIYQHTPMISAPDSQPLAVEYNQALAIVLRTLPDAQLAELSVNLNQILSNRPCSSSPNAVNLAAAKVETEAIERWNRRKCGNSLLHCILTGSLFLPDENDGSNSLYLQNQYHH